MSNLSCQVPPDLLRRYRRLLMELEFEHDFRVSMSEVVSALLAQGPVSAAEAIALVDRGAPPSNGVSLGVRIPNEVHRRYRRLVAELRLDYGRSTPLRALVIAVLASGPETALQLRVLVERRRAEARVERPSASEQSVS
jgi:hypothetical protein